MKYKTISYELLNSELNYRLNDKRYFPKYKGLSFSDSNFANKIYTKFPKLGAAYTYSQNVTWIRRVTQSGVNIIDIGIDVSRNNRSIYYTMEILTIIKNLMV